MTHEVLEGLFVLVISKFFFNFRRLEETHKNKSVPKVPDPPTPPPTNSQPTSKLKVSMRKFCNLLIYESVTH